LRDLIRGQPAADWDVATDARPDEVKRAFRHVVPTGEKHGTVSVILDGHAYEVTTLRGEGTYTDGRRPDAVEFHDDIELDLLRRDFTVNAIALDPVTHEVFDPANGLVDLKNRVLRAVGDPAARFGEDGLRILRGARFVATLEMTLEPATRAAIPGALDVFRKVSGERVRDEWLKTMKAARPSHAFEVMRETGILGVTYPEMLEMYGCTQNKWHSFDVWGHTMAALDATPRDRPMVRVASLLHDIAKPRTRAIGEKTNDATFYGHERVGADMADDWLRRYHFSNEERERITHVIRHHLVCYDRGWSDAAVRRWMKRIGSAAMDDLLVLHRADTLGKGREVPDELASIDQLRARVAAVEAAGNALSTRDLAVNGKDVMAILAIPPGRRIGEVLEALLDEVLEDPALNEREHLLDRIRAMGAEARRA
ncbi:MAG: CCA tRNA nucleotidyltransferase, partial [Deltaproteobacteria bacterium]|nr:CCA tRNA nucleotidyltransferase [Deltaproteobacteria bacterium]